MLASHSRPARRSLFQFRPALEPLEGRLLMAGLDVPQLSSRPGASATLYLDFDGHSESSWKSYSNVNSPAYSRDSDPTTFSAAELSSINEIWTRVAEDFAPFKINVTTVMPASFDHGTTLTVVIGGSWSDWYGTQVNGVSLLGSFTSADPNVAYVFSNNLGTGFPRWVADQVSHEAGRCFGLLNQSTWSGNVLQAELSSGSNGWAPIMGSSLFASRTTWYNGTTDISPTSFQDDMTIIAGASNGFGYVADDFPDTLATAAQLPISGSSVNLSGLISQTGDQDVFKFTTAGGNLSFNLAVSAFGANLDSVLELRDASGQVVKIANDTTSGVFTSALSANVAAGTYYLIVRPSGGYGNVGQYTLTGTVVPSIVAAPEISVLLNGSDLVSSASVNFGSALVGTPVVQSLIVQNLGNGDLTLSLLDGSAFPAGFSLVTNLSVTTLAPGQSATFSVQLDATTAGSFGGTIHLLSNDADESSFDIVLGGTVTQPIITVPEIRIWGNAVELTSGDTVSLGSTLVGTPVTETFTIQNVGDGDLLLSPIDSSALPAGFSLVQGLGATILHPTDFTTFVLQFDTVVLGTFGGTLQILSNDADESSFNVNLSAAVTAPEIRVFEGSTELASGDTVSFGSTPVGTPVTRTITIQNAGDGNLLVSGFDANSLPAGYSFIAGFGATTIAPGFSVILSVQFDASAAGAFGGTIHILNSDADEGSFDVVLDGVAAAPQISVLNGSAEITSGGTIDFGTTQAGSPVTRIVTVTNVGNANLVLLPIDPNTLPAGFSLVNNFSVTTLAPGQSTTFSVKLDATVAGSPLGVIHILSNDSNEGSFDIALAGIVSDPLPAAYVKTIDNGAAGFTTTGTWHAQNSKNGFENDIQFANKAEKNDKTVATATWTFTGLAAGQYRVSVTSPASASYASDAPYSVFDGATLLRTVRINQKQVGGDLAADGFRWQNLGSFKIQGGTLVVQLTNRAGGQVVADAVRIEKVAATADPGSTTPATQLPCPKPQDNKAILQTQGTGGSHKPSPQAKPVSHSTPHNQGKKAIVKSSSKHDDVPSKRNVTQHQLPKSHK
jgi:hypothetical protein